MQDATCAHTQDFFLSPKQLFENANHEEWGIAFLYQATLLLILHGILPPLLFPQLAFIPEIVESIVSVFGTILIFFVLTALVHWTFLILQWQSLYTKTYTLISYAATPFLFFGSFPPTALISIIISCVYFYIGIQKTHHFNANKALASTCLLTIVTILFL